MSLANTQDIITKFELYIGDETELSSSEELDLCQKIYNQILASEEWEFLKKEASGSVSGTDITQPDDFDRLTTDQKIYLGAKFQERAQVPFENRRSYDGQGGFFYYDARQEKFVFTQSENDTYSFDYIFVPPTLNITDSDPLFPVRFYDMIFHGMCVDSDIINMSDKARSYAALNNSKYDSILADAKSWNKKQSGFNTYGI